MAQYERYKWFTEPRLDPATGNEIPGMRWRAWEQLRQLEQAQGPRNSSWFNDGPANVSGRCLALAVDPTDPNTVYAGFASSGIWKTTDAGTTWVPLDDYLPTLAVSAIKIDPSNHTHIWMGTGEGWNNVDAVHGVGLLESHDAGATWNTTGFSYAISQGRDVYVVEYNPTTGTLMLGADNGLWRSLDGGATFTQLFNGSWTDLQIKKGSTSTWFGSAHGTTAGFYISNDDGATWTLVTNGTPTTGIANNRFALTANDTNYIYWAIDRGDQSDMSIYKSTNGGASFSDVFDGAHYGAQGSYNLTISVDPNNKNTVYSGGVSF